MKQCKVNNGYWYSQINNHIGLYDWKYYNKKNDNLQDKSLLLVDDDNPFRERLARAMEKKVLPYPKLMELKKALKLLN